VGVVVVVLMVTAVVVVGWFVFRHPPTSVTPERLRQATGESEPSATVSAEEAIARVKARPEVSAFLQMGPNPGATPRVELAREDGGSYVVHAYTELTQAPQGSPATLDFGWYRVSKTTGEVTQVPGP